MDRATGGDSKSWWGGGGLVDASPWWRYSFLGSETAWWYAVSGSRRPVSGLPGDAPLVRRTLPGGVVGPELRLARAVS
ncbi:hypothetical protein MUK42_20396 [Musa troglodytarum]|uniref:Uncharacterized protein n=1 Tax=Musa troglodytarum TaxID=320322 RepID=A0A9E7GEX4_9LILI|nr:hypothetical protein MUK42_20396 [Musa troglodytarum]